MQWRTSLAVGILTACAAGGMVGLVACSGDDDTSPGTPDAGVPDGVIPENDSGPPPDGGNDAGPLCTATPCVVSIAPANFQTCAVLVDGTIRCWGLNDRGQIGQPPPPDAGGEVVRNSKPQPVPGVTGIAEVAGGGLLGEYGFTCARTNEGTVQCWGDNSLGQLGHADFDAGTHLPVAVQGVSQATQLTAGASHTCVVLADGGVTCWGAAAAGELGRQPPDGGLSLPPGPFEGLGGPVAQVRGGGEFTCALGIDGTVWCAGSGAAGKLGVPDAGGPEPVRVPGLSGVTELWVGWLHACALAQSTGNVVCWGDNSAGQLGQETISSSPTPRRIDLPIDRKAVHLGGGGLVTCAVLDDDSLWCWGPNLSGILGPTDGGSDPRPRRIEGLPQQKILQVRGGYLHMCALFEGGSMWCWGSDLAGELGRGDDTPDGGSISNPTPAPVVF